MIMIKLIVNYRIQVWKSNGYSNQNLSIILEFENINDISNEAIEQFLHEKHRYTYTIEAIQQIK